MKVPIEKSYMISIVQTDRYVSNESYISVTCQSVYISSKQFRAAYNEHWLSILSVIQIH